nr:glycosyltransferase family 39 protein [Streptomyces polyasparticus]
MPAPVVALGAFAAARCAGIAVLAAVARRTGQDTSALLGASWDARWYKAIAAHGYGRTLHFGPEVTHSDLAFFPLYPGLIRAVTTVLPVSGGAAGLLVAWLAAALAAYGIFAIGAHLFDRRTATLLVLLWGLLPHSVVLSMAYTEPVLTACAAWSLYALLTGRWLWAGALAALAGLSRPNGFAVAAAVIVVAAFATVRGRGSRRALLAALLAPTGWCAYVLWVGRRKGDLLGGYFGVQDGWGSRFDLGLASLRFTRHMLLDGERFVFPMTLVIVAAAVVLYALLIADRAPLALLAYSGVLLLIVLGGSGFFESKARFLLPAFPLLIPLARALARTAKTRPWHATVVVAALAGLSFGYGAYLVAVARIPL